MVHCHAVRLPRGAALIPCTIGVAQALLHAFGEWRIPGGVYHLAASNYTGSGVYPSGAAWSHAGEEHLSLTGRRGGVVPQGSSSVSVTTLDDFAARGGASSEGLPSLPPLRRIDHTRDPHSVHCHTPCTFSRCGHS